MKEEVIDVDKPVFLDLTEEIHIDLTDDNDIVELSPSRISLLPPRRTKHRPNTTFGLCAGPLSSINIKISSSPAPNALSSRTSLSPPKERKVIVLDDDDDDDDDVTLLNRSKPTQFKDRTTKRFFELDSEGEDVGNRTKKQKRQEDDDTDEEEAYARCHAGYDLNNENIWKPPTVNQEKFTFDVPESLEYISISDHSSNPSLRPRRRQLDFSNPHHYPFTKLPEWKPLRRYIVPPPPRLIGYFLATKLRRGSRQRIVQPMKRFASFRNASGSINHIEQSGPWIAIASAATGGHADDTAIGEIDPYNREGSITVWNGKPEVLPGHCRRKNIHGISAEVTLQPLEKYYTVNDVKFDPHNSSLVSAGNDKTVYIWKFNDETNTYQKDDRISFPHPPTGLAFQPNTTTSTIAIAERSLYLYSDVTNYPTRMPPISLSGHKKKDFCIGAMTWGRGPTENRLFASSEPLDSTRFIGHHKAIDAKESEILYAFDEDGAGDEMTITNDGSRLALITRREDHVHFLRIYDIRNSDPKVIQCIELPSFPSSIEGEVNSASFSSDGIYLAMGRNDNSIHVYDSRFLDRLLFEYKHHGPSQINPGNHSYGVVKVQWVDEDSVLPFGLVTGGNDEPMLMETLSGDGSGEVTILDFGPQGYHSIYR
ncbi:hypothetical protein C0995_008431 [Termitomyces sp. Mi166|nr:hypothetical protein C0995_008431 [Termitomyces sp. Mi166\